MVEDVGCFVVGLAVGEEQVEIWLRSFLGEICHHSESGPSLFCVGAAGA